MNDLTPATTIGHNSGLAAYFGEFIDRVNAGVATANKWLAAYGTTPVTDEETAKRLADVINQIEKELKAIDGDRLKQVRPHIEEQKTINDKARELGAGLTAALTKLIPMRQAWLKYDRDQKAAEINRRAEEARKAQEEALRLAAEAAKPTATVEQIVQAEKAQETVAESMDTLNTAMSAKATVKGDFMQRAVGLRTIWTAQITDLGAAAVYYATNPVGKAKMLECIQKLADQDCKRIKATETGIPGVKGLSEER